VSLEVTPAAVAALAERGVEPRFGARPIRRAIQREVETPVSRMVLRGELHEGDRMRVDFAGDAFVFEAERGERPAGGGPERPEAASGLAGR